MQLTQHAEVGGREGQESSASSLRSVTRDGVGWMAAYRFRPWPSSGHPAQRLGLIPPAPNTGSCLPAPSWHSPGPGPCCARPLPAPHPTVALAPEQVRGARLRTRFSSSAGNLVWNWQRVPLL